MNEIINIAANLPWHNNAILLLIIVMIWEMVWKWIALWKSGKNKQFVWFVCLFVFNTAGILPIIYLLTFKKDK
jgi:methionyl-tRNA synthetase